MGKMIPRAGLEAPTPPPQDPPATDPTPDLPKPTDPRPEPTDPDYPEPQLEILDSILGILWD